MKISCQHCGKEHSEWPPDFGFQRPDAIWALAAPDRAQRVLENNDLCVLKGIGGETTQYFVRGVFHVPLSDSSETWGLGLWIRVSYKNYLHYCKTYNEDGRSFPTCMGWLANEFPGWKGTMGTRVRVQLQDIGERPTFVAINTAASDVAIVQRKGLTGLSLHRFLERNFPALIQGVET